MTIEAEFHWYCVNISAAQCLHLGSIQYLPFQIWFFYVIGLAQKSKNSTEYP